ncbi:MULTISPECIES: type II secretion system minor pseudopilin GspH [Pseudomonas aeruginosa group]|uniref:type II secretion system minor pseudopilin GspH n=1 Tax=Pseudomonas aeruginosa group TaxID=136841 RepID=UPI0006B28542|nr:MULTISPECIES: type II secretion system minor pseudopilin GspH [Pseudomonas aeruginosa group]KPD30874.1 type II secretion system protein GspH [Pseudomonas paraeruginosa]KQB31012.1 type II secretion system protein GspH [Pseudomonas paraeruginosa]MDT1025349.1 type II secretion system minor pseudopilin GspH [Pseudomonas paraeruginosa]PHJ31395.1 type II secretion system protein GspH [Pseudomonas paraeruginosa]QQV49924.1 type II secretion system minor pseudopilin GspH [Pseudomonas aeruginosa]
MPVRGMLRQPGQRGFTLLEVLVVVLLVGLLAGLAGLAQVDSGGQQARRETERLRSLFGLLRQDALLSQRDYGLRIERRGYSVQVLDLDGEWRPTPGYRPQTLPENLRLNLEAGADAPTPGRSRRSRAPQLLVLSSDEITPFSLRLEYRGQPLYALSSDGLAEVRVEAL